MKLHCQVKEVNRRFDDKCGKEVARREDVALGGEWLGAIQAASRGHHGGGGVGPELSGVLRRQSRSGKADPTHVIEIGFLTGGLERVPVGRKFNVRCADARRCEGDESALGVACHVEQEVGDSPASASGCGNEIVI